jgi:DNA polymerase-3 subunit delta'
VRFNPLGRGTIAALLTAHQQTAPDLAATLAAMAGGSYAKAIAMASGDWAARRHWVLTGMGLLTPTTMDGLSISRLLAYAEQLVKAKAHLDDALELIKTWLRDLVVVKYVPDQVLHQDLMATLSPGERELDDDALVASYNAVEAAQSALRANANARLCIETLVLTLAGRIALPPLAAG